MKTSITITSLFLLFISICTHAQQITSITPNKANPGDILTVSITGSNTNFAINQSCAITSNVSTVFLKMNNQYVKTQHVTPTSNTKLTAFFDLSDVFNDQKLIWDVGVVYKTNDTISLKKCFSTEGTGAKIVDISPNTICAGDKLDVTITGKNTYFFAQASTSIKRLFLRKDSKEIDAIYSLSLSKTTLRASFDLDYKVETGKYDIVVIPNNTEIIYKNGFNVLPENTQTLSCANHKEGVGDLLEVAITGNHTSFETCGTVNNIKEVYLRQSTSKINTDSIRVIDSKSLRAYFNIKQGNVGNKYDIVVEHKNNNPALVKENCVELVDANTKRLGKCTIDNTKQGEDFTAVFACRSMNVKNKISKVFLKNNYKYVFSNSINYLNDTVVEALFSIPRDMPIGYYSLGIIEKESNTQTIRDNSILVSMYNPDDLCVFTSTPILEIDEDSSYRYNISTSNISSNKNYPIELMTAPSWVYLEDNNNGTGLLTCTPDNDVVGKHSIVLKTNPKVTQSYILTVNNTNDAPIIKIPVPDISVKIDYELSYTVSQESFIDVDKNDTVIISLTGLSGGSIPSWLTFNEAHINGTPAKQDSGVYTLVLHAADMNGAIVHDTFMVFAGLETAIKELNYNLITLEVAPNPISLSNNEIFRIQIPETNFQSIDVQIMDVVGNILTPLDPIEAQLDRNVYGATTYLLNPRMKNGRKMAPGSYAVIIKIICQDGKSKYYQAFIGVKK